MQYILVPSLVLFTVCGNAFSQETSFSGPGENVGGKIVSAEGAFENFLPKENPFSDFRARLRAAVGTRDMAAIKALYQTNGVSAEQLNEELSRWRPMLEGDAASRVSIQNHGCIFRDFSKSSSIWKHLAERLTTHKATHLVQLLTTKDYWMLPLVEVESRLLIVPSDKSKDMGLKLEDIQPDRAANVSQPVPPTTNSPSGTSGSPH
jgi:hypothetical protein